MMCYAWVGTFPPREGFLEGEGVKDCVFWSLLREGKGRVRFHKPFLNGKRGKD